MLEYKWKIGKKTQLRSLYICLPLYLLELSGCMLKKTQFKLALVVKEVFIER